jgi:hypothetical protein
MVKCILCGQEFKLISWKHLYYKHGLTVEQYRAPGGLTGSEKICETCGEVFIPDHRKQRFCSPDCAHIHHSETYRGENNPNFGKTVCHTDETKRKISQNNARYWKGKKRPNVGKKIAQKLKGRTNLALKGRKFPGRTNSGQFPKDIEPWNKGKKMPPAYGEKVSEAMYATPGAIRYGPDNTSWKGGITPEHTKLRRSEAYSDWRNEVFHRDDYTCQICEQRGGRLVAHHIYSYAAFAELRFDIDNGVTLCRSCHSSLHNDPDNPHRHKFIKGEPDKH